jgi:hypothetical protein
MPKVTRLPLAAAALASPIAVWKRVGFGLGEHQGRDAAGGRGVAAQGLQNDRARRDVHEAKLLGDDETVLVIGDDEGRGEARLIRHAQRRLLQ